MGIFQEAIKEIPVVNYNGTITEEDLNGFFERFMDRPPTTYQIYGDSVNYWLSLPDKMFLAIYYNKNIQALVGSSQLKAINERLDKLGIKRETQELKKYGTNPLKTNPLEAHSGVLKDTGE